MYKHCTVCIAVQLSVHSLHSDLCGMCLGRPSVAGHPTVLNHQRELLMSSLNTIITCDPVQLLTVMSCIYCFTIKTCKLSAFLSPVHDSRV